MTYSSLRQFVFSLFLFISIISCNRESTPSALPKILKMSIAGVPDEDITIDESNRKITVLLPPSLPSLQVMPSFLLTEGASVIGVPIDFSLFCPCTGSFSVSGVYTVPLIVNIKDSYRVVYEVTLKSKLPMKLIESSKTIVIEANPNQTPENFMVVYLPVENYLGSSPIVAISVAKIGQAPNWIGAPDVCFNTCPTQLNKVGIPLYGYRGTGTLTPGEYEVQVRLAGETSSIKFPQSIIVK